MAMVLKLKFFLCIYLVYCQSYKLQNINKAINHSRFCKSGLIIINVKQAISH